LPKNVRVASYIAQSALTPRVRAVVSHGGFNTVMGALADATPVCTLPLSSDHPVNAWRCVQMGLGTSVTTWKPMWGFPTARPADVTAAAVVDAVGPLLSDESYAHRVGALAVEVNQLPRPADVVPMIEDLARAR
jgi:UDP:flavonoid glycosyltransferase YjiC (YdhE family)